MLEKNNKIKNQCNTCNGSGLESRESKKCPKCLGKRMCILCVNKGGLLISNYEICRKCNGDGEIHTKN